MNWLGVLWVGVFVFLVVMVMVVLLMYLIFGKVFLYIILIVLIFGVINWMMIIIINLKFWWRIGFEGVVVLEFWMLGNFVISYVVLVFLVFVVVIMVMMLSYWVVFVVGFVWLVLLWVGYDVFCLVWCCYVWGDECIVLVVGRIEFRVCVGLVWFFMWVIDLGCVCRFCLCVLDMVYCNGMV